MARRSERSGRVLRFQPVFAAALGAAALSLSAAAGGGSEVGLGPAAWSPDGKKIVFGRSATEGTKIVVMNADGTDRKVVWERRKGQRSWRGLGDRIGYSSDGRYLAFLETNFRLVVLDQRGHTIREWADVGMDFWWGPGGKRLIAGVWELGGRLLVLSIDRTRMQVLTHRQDFNPTWSPDGKWIAFARARGSVDPHTQCGDVPFDVYAIGARGRGLRRWARDAGAVLWSPKGDRVALFRAVNCDVSAARYEIWQVRRNRRLGRLLRRVRAQNAFCPPRWSSDGTRLLILRKGSPTARILTRMGGGCHDWGFSPDGKRLLFVARAGHDCAAPGIWVLTLATHRLQRLVGHCR